VPDPGGRGVAAKRQGRRPGRSVRRHGIADRFRAARIGYGAFEGDHRLGDPVHADLADAVDFGDARGKRDAGSDQEDHSRSGTKGSCSGADASTRGGRLTDLGTDRDRRRQAERAANNPRTSGADAGSSAAAEVVVRE